MAKKSESAQPAPAKKKESGFERTTRAQARDDLFDPNFSLDGEKKEEDSGSETSKSD
jgi:hypothetical protein